jgi:hypothetical protein
VLRPQAAEGGHADPMALSHGAVNAKETTDVKNRRIRAAVVGALAAIASSLLVSAPAHAADCSAGTVVNVVAHEDDDLLFLSPDLLHDIDSGMCVTTVFLTAGDAEPTLVAGSSTSAQQYWRDGRETGSLTAYAQMGGMSWGWYETDAGVPGRAIQAVDNSENPRIRLIYLRLKDGLQGELHDGIMDPLLKTPVKTLWKTWYGLSDITSLRDDQHPERGIETYSRQELIDTLGAIYGQARNLVEIKTQDDGGGNPESRLVWEASVNDHPDHVATALFAGASRDAYAPDTPLIKYQDYPNAVQDDNVTGTDFDRKYAAFYAYALNDSHICGFPNLDSACPNGLGDWYPKLVATQYPAR